MLDHALIVMYGSERPRPPVPDHALDRHTKAGRELGRGYAHFVEEGSRLENLGDVDDPYTDEARAVLAGQPQPGGQQLSL